MIKFSLFKVLLEGGWATTATQHTRITPQVVGQVMSQMHELVPEFNAWLSTLPDPPGSVQVGSPTGSGYYYKQDVNTKEYGDVDLQMIAPNPQGLGHAAYANSWNQLWDEWVARHQPPQVNPHHSTPGHPIMQVTPEHLVQVDFMWHEPAHATWGLVRSVPPRGIKGLLNGNMFSVLGTMLNMSLQHSGAQVKQDESGAVVPFKKQKGVTLHTITHDPHNLFLHILQFVAGKPLTELEIPHMLNLNPGVKWPDPQIHAMVRGIKGLAQAFTQNGLWGRGMLITYANESEFLDEFWRTYEQKAQAEIHNPKRLKAETPEAQARAQRDVDQIKKGLDMVRSIWHET